MGKKPQKMWPVFVLGAVVILAIALKVHSFFFGEGNETRAQFSASVGQLAENSGGAFSMANWQIGGSQVDSDFSSVEPMKNFTVSDIKVSGENSLVALRKYAVDLKFALKPYSNPNIESEPILLASLYEKNDVDALAKLSQAEKYHAESLSSLLSMNVPSDLTKYHLVLVNSVGRMHFLVKNMLAVADKPVLALTSARIFGPEVDRFGEALSVLNNVFSNKGLVFSKSDEVKIYLNATK